MVNNTRLLLFLLLIWSGNHSLNARTWYVSIRGDDQNPGSRELPYRTINRGAAMAMPGDTVFVLEGCYRERVAPPRGGLQGKPIVYLAEPGKRVFIKGSEIWEPEWRKDAEGVYSAIPEDHLFTDRSPEYVDHYNPFRTELASTPYQREGKYELQRGWEGDSTLVYTCGQVCVDDQMLKEVPYQRELEPGTWYFDPETGRLHIDFGSKDPADCLVEITTRKRIFAPYERGLGYIVVEGFIMEHAGTNYPTNFWAEDRWAQKGAMGIEAGHHWIIRHNVIRRAKTFALDCGKVDRHSSALGVEAHDNLIEENYILENGAAGIMSSSSLNMVIRGNVILYNNSLSFLGMKRWEQSGIKCHNPKNAVVSDNYIAYNNLTFGIWFDNQFPDARITRNFLAFNGRSGIFLEMSDYDFDRCLVDNNIVIGNATNPVYIHDASGATFVHNLFANPAPQAEFGQGVFLRPAEARTKTYHNSFYNNLFIDNARVYNINYPSHRSGPQRMDYNMYGTGSKDRDFCINKLSDGPSPYTDQEFADLVKADLGRIAPPPRKMSGEKFHSLRVEHCALHRDSEEERNTPLGVMYLTFEEWKTFWKKHGLENDQHSVLSEGNRVSYDPDAHELSLDLAFDPAKTGSISHDLIDLDYFEEEISSNGRGKPGPIQSVMPGKNVFRVWNGLHIPKLGELPEPSHYQFVR